MKIFVASSFSSQVDEGGRVLAMYREEVEKLLSSLRLSGQDVFCASEDHNWTMGNQSANDAVVQDTAEIDSADVVVALLTNPGSAGVNFEVGYAVKAGKRVILVQRPGTELRWFNQGLVDAGLTELATPENVAKIIAKS